MSRDDPRATCATCRYWARGPLSDKRGACRFDAPRSSHSPDLYWPGMHETEWCGQHEYTTTGKEGPF